MSDTTAVYEAVFRAVEMSIRMSGSVALLNLQSYPVACIPEQH
jgi:hypothetical protein